MKIKKNNYGINSYSTYGNLGNYGKKNKVTLPNLGFGKKTLIFDKNNTFTPI